MNKSIKVVLNKCLNRDMKEVKKTIGDMQYKYGKAYNIITNYLYLWDTNIMNLKNLYDTKITEKDILGKSKSAWIENRMNEIIDGALSSNVAQARQDVMNKYNKSKKDGLLKGKVTLPTYKLDSKIIIHNVAYKLRNQDGYFIEIGLFNKDKQKELDVKRIDFQIDKLDNNKKATINKILSGEYKQGSAQLSISKKDKIELIISYSFEPQVKELNKDRILGIDLGIVKVATMSIWDNNKINEYGVKGDWEWFSWKANVIDGEELIKFRQKQFNIKRKRQVNKKYAGEGRIGHGYNTRVKGVNDSYVSNFVDTYNHKISKYIVNFAVKNDCGVIQMENLSGATSNVHEKFLKEWSYYDLQEKITCKAQEQGIEVIRVNPMYTSKRCSNCGCIHEDNRNCKENQEKFECAICNHRENADVNASKNISIPNIDIIIKETEVVKCS
ncbi:transposase [Clostridium sp. UBA4395]|uniref:transposase n=1 Tax=Clostridium sp. UBA4395 TaxID=1946360 RepID=UPI0032172D8D